jgi:hypothetical protein
MVHPRAGQAARATFLHRANMLFGRLVGWLARCLVGLLVGSFVCLLVG